MGLAVYDQSCALGIHRILPTSLDLLLSEKGQDFPTLEVNNKIGTPPPPNSESRIRLSDMVFPDSRSERIFPGAHRNLCAFDLLSGPRIAGIHRNNFYGHEDFSEFELLEYSGVFGASKRTKAT